MEAVLEDSEILLESAQTYPDTLLSPSAIKKESIASSELSGTSSARGETSIQPVGSSKRSTTASRRRTTDPETIRKIEDIVQQIVLALQREDASVSIALRSPKRPGTSRSAKISTDPAHKQYILSFPGDTPEEAWRFSTPGLVETVCSRTASMLTCSPAVVLRMLELIHEALVNDVVVSKRFAEALRPASITMLTVSHCRNIYYKDPELFKSQKVVDRYVDILSYTFGIQRAALNVVSRLAFYHSQVFLSD